MDGQSFLFVNYFCAVGAENSQKLGYNSELSGDLKLHHVLLRPSIFVFLYYIIKHTKYWKLKCSVFFYKIMFFKFLTVGVHKSRVTEFYARCLTCST